MAITNMSLKVDETIKARYQRLAEARKRSPHWLVKEAMSEYIDREEKRESFRQDAIEAWEEYQATGLHLTGEEVHEWLTKIANGEDAELPECHT